MRLHKMDDTISFNDDKLKFTSDKDDQAWSDWYTPSDWMAKRDNVITLGDFKQYEDNVEHPFHYTQGKQEAIDTIEDAISEAPGPKAGFLQAQVLKYMLRLWHKTDAKEDAEKARWYLNRLIDSLN